MFLKPKSTVNNPRALLYRRFTVMEESYTKLLSDELGDKKIAQYQTNKYYYVGSFDYMLTDSEDSTRVQPMKGLITPLTTMNIRTFSDDLEIKTDDLVVVDGRLFAIENPEIVIKRMPKKFKIYFMTLNSIL